jgi:TolB-like protein/DNA-binding winged helix-turn-helix (wHTH) protein
MSLDTPIQFGEWTLYPREGELERGGERQRLQDLPLRILVELVCHPGQLVTREQLIAKLWPKGVVEFESGLNTAVSKLRATLGDSAETPRYIETIPRKGYRFIASVTQPGARDQRPALPKPEAQGSAPVAIKRRAALYVAAVALAFAVVVLIAIRHLGGSGPPERLRLAVMPFTSLSADPANAFFAEGMHEEILATLAARATQLDVISRTTMITFRGSAKSAPAIAAELGATHLLEGAVRREGDDVRVTVTLIDARSDRQTWTRTFDRQLGSAVTLQADVAEEVASRLAVELTHEGTTLPAATSPVAYDLYLRAKLASQAVSQRTSPDETRQIEQWLSDAIALDQSFGAAYLERARIRIVRFVRNHDLSSLNTQGAQADIETAQRLLGNVADVAALQSRYLLAVHGDTRLAVSWVESPAVTSSRDSAVMQWRGFVLCRSGRPEDGLRVYSQVAELDPLNRGIFNSWAIELWGMREPAEALRVIEAFNRRGVGHIDYGDLEFAFTGRVDRLRRDVESMGAGADPDARLAATFDLLRFEQRFDDLRALVASASVTTLRQRGFREQQAAGISDKPVAELRGWSALLSGDRAAAEADGKTLLDYAQRQAASPRDTVYLEVLRAEGRLFSGDRNGAIEDARAALADARVAFATNTLRFVGIITARVLAWAGAEEEATEVLEDLATKFTALGPAEIVRDPLFSLPLRGNSRYRQLATQLEAQIEANQAIFP